MPSNRRVKLFALLIVIFLVTFFFYTTSVRQAQSSDLKSPDEFYSKTVKALKDAGEGGGGGAIRSGGGAQSRLGKPMRGDDKEDLDNDDDDDAGRRERLKKAADEAKVKANAKAPKPDPPSSVVGKGSAQEGAVAGRKTYPIKPKDGEAQKPIEEKVETEEEHRIEVEMNSILKRSPIIIFSKSYCPYSKRAKHILLEQYSIEPAPFVVELDQHPMGTLLQASLAQMTGRKTVPNVLISGKSIGGGDEVSALDSEGELIDLVKRMGGRRMLKVEKVVKVEEKAKEEPPKDQGKESEKQKHGLKRRQ
ncbi:hypothetical protein BP6252_01108 [Coleophoma cylindrospora]|uniref:Glutaredoxin domain-containing protein n=1 Tax=Coleophoma cylindrospora TaxID=1849047 RepID=A0A3D8SRY9_9HELO|nr:hypothetical protein BP6252_01108 [Coleophoma cylindrospora]